MALRFLKKRGRNRIAKTLKYYRSNFNKELIDEVDLVKKSSLDWRNSLHDKTLQKLNRMKEQGKPKDYILKSIKQDRNNSNKLYNDSLKYLKVGADIKRRRNYFIFDGVIEDRKKSLDNSIEGFKNRLKLF